MIQAHELRIGNLVNFTYRHKKEYLSRPVRVTEIRTDYVMTDDKGLPLQLHYRGGAISPIPISPDILEKCGFERNIMPFTNEVGFSKSGSGYFIGFTDNKDNGFLFHNPHFNRNYKYLHQLQNLFYILTGEELTLNP